MTKKQLADNVYDLIRLAILPEKQNDDWAKLVREHAGQSKKELEKAIGNKNIEVGNDYIQIGTNNPLVIKIYRVGK